MTEAETLEAESPLIAPQGISPSEESDFFFATHVVGREVMTVGRLAGEDYVRATILVSQFGELIPIEMSGTRNRSSVVTTALCRGSSNDGLPALTIRCSMSSNLATRFAARPLRLPLSRGRHPRATRFLLQGAPPVSRPREVPTASATAFCIT